MRARVVGAVGVRLRGERHRPGQRARSMRHTPWHGRACTRRSSRSSRSRALPPGSPLSPIAGRSRSTGRGLGCGASARWMGPQSSSPTRSRRRTWRASWMAAFGWGTCSRACRADWIIASARPPRSVICRASPVPRRPPQMGISPGRMRKLMEGRGAGEPGVSGKMGELARVIDQGQWCASQGSLMRALAYGILDRDGERYRLALSHHRRCPSCRAYVVSLRGIAVALPPVLLPGVRAALAGISAGGAGSGASGAAAVSGAGGGGMAFAGAPLGAKLAAGCLLAVGVGAGCVGLQVTHPPAQRPPRPPGTPAARTAPAAAVPAGGTVPGAEPVDSVAGARAKGGAGRWPRLASSVSSLLAQRGARAGRRPRLPPGRKTARPGFRVPPSPRRPPSRPLRRRGPPCASSAPVSAQARGKIFPIRASARGFPRGRRRPVAIARRGSSRSPTMSTQSCHERRSRTSASGEVPCSTVLEPLFTRRCQAGMSGSRELPLERHWAAEPVLGIDLPADRVEQQRDRLRVATRRAFLDADDPRLCQGSPAL